MSRGPWHVAVLMGGLSSEREVSLSSGKGCADALEGQVARVSRIDAGRDLANVLSGLIRGRRRARCFHAFGRTAGAVA